MIKAVIFDFDDTLCLTEEACFYLENEALKRMGREPMSRKAHQANWGKHLEQAITERSPGVDVQKFLELHRQLQPEFMAAGKVDNISQENLKVLDDLAEQGLTLMVLTSRDAYEAQHLMDPQHHIGSRMSAVYHRDNTDYLKPDPRVFEVLERYHELEPEECVYVGDAVTDAAAAKQAGLHFVATLESGLREKDDFKDYPVDAFIYHLGELPEVIKQLQNKTAP